MLEGGSKLFFFIKAACHTLSLLTINDSYCHFVSLRIAETDTILTLTLTVMQRMWNLTIDLGLRQLFFFFPKVDFYYPFK